MFLKHNKISNIIKISRNSGTLSKKKIKIDFICNEFSISGGQKWQRAFSEIPGHFARVISQHISAYG